MNMDIVDELLDDDAFDPKKLFDEKEYSTLIIDRNGFNKKQNEAADFVEALLDKKTSRAEMEEIFRGLKDANAQQLLVDSIAAVKKPAEKAVLAAACWESGLDFTGHYLFFAELAAGSDFQLAMEALTVVENCEGALDEATLAAAIKIAQNSTSENKELTNDLLTAIQSRIPDDDTK